jgi:hypothetical protein
MNRITSLHFSRFSPDDPRAERAEAAAFRERVNRVNGRKPPRKQTDTEDRQPASKLALPPASKVDAASDPSIKIDTPFGLYHTALRESENAQRTLRRIGTDASSEAHGTLTLALAALRKTVDAVIDLIEMEAGPFESRDPK